MSVQGNQKSSMQPFKYSGLSELIFSVFYPLIINKLNNMKLFRSLLPTLFIAAASYGQAPTLSPTDPQPGNENQEILTGADRINVYLPLIKGRTVGIFANQTSMVGNVHLVDTLTSLGVKVKVIFAPEHGFRGTADAGEKIGNY